MIKSRQFWQDVDLAIGILLLRQRLHHIITEGRNTSHSLLVINKGVAPSPDRVRILSRYFEAMKEDKKPGIVHNSPPPDRNL